MCVPMWVYGMCEQVPKEVRSICQNPRYGGYLWVWATLRWFWGQSNGPLQNQKVLLMVGPSPQNPSAVLNYHKVYFGVINLYKMLYLIYIKLPIR